MTLVYSLKKQFQVKVARTKVKAGQDPVFDETFDLDDIPPDVLTFTVTIMNRGRRAKDAEVAEVTVDLTNLKSGSETEEWYNLRGVTPIGEWGSIRLRLRYLHDLIMPAEEYSPLKELILDSNLEVVRALAELCHSDRLQLATALLRYELPPGEYSNVLPPKFKIKNSTSSVYPRLYSRLYTIKRYVIKL